MSLFLALMAISPSKPTGRLPQLPNSVHENIQFTVEMERDGYLPFLYIVDIYCMCDRSLGHRVYHKPKHTNHYLHANFHHNSSNKQAVLSMLEHRPEPCVIMKAYVMSYTSQGHFQVEWL
jgi:hypothetical protein